MKHDRHWYQDAVIYELYVDLFAGDFRGLTSKLDYLDRLGITCIWLLPHYPSPMVDDGYDISDYRGVRPELGTLEDFDAFVARAHEHGIRVLIDLVLNHTSTEHPWFTKALADPNSPEHQYYLWSATGTELADSVNVFDHLKPRNWIDVPNGDGFYFATFYPQQADLNWDNPAVFREITGIMDFWLSRGVDGFRMDAISHLIKREGTRSTHLPETHAVLRRIRAYLDAHHPDAVILGEANGELTDVRSYFGDGDECHMLFNFPLMVRTFLALVRGDDDIARKFAAQSSDIPLGCAWANVLRNHDELALKHVPDDVREEIFDAVDPGGKYLMKREMGTAVRLATALLNDPERITHAISLLLEQPGSPVIYMGDELGTGNTPAPGPDIRRTSRSAIDWSEVQRQEANPDSVLNRVRKLIAERNN
ncbi:MAG TPA: alpha-amylase family glycosyl hydrolase [Candidatus Paceibacterota bacterium]|nr:alpha-amylase family glycosyl hydrolase [Candidatus Paceibacterota bacterium]